MNPGQGPAPEPEVIEPEQEAEQEEGELYDGGEIPQTDAPPEQSEN